MVQPTREEFERLGAGGLAVPIHRTIFADFDTPVSAFAKIDDGRSSFLLESVEGGETWGRYSFLGSRPAAVFRAHHGQCTLERDGRTETLEGTDPFAVLDLVDAKLSFGLAGDDREVGDAQHLADLPEPGETFADGACDGAADAGVYFIEQQGVHAVLRRNERAQRKHHA